MTDAESGPLSRPGPQAAMVALTAAIYGLAAYASIGLAFAGTQASPVWPPSGLALAALLLGGRRQALGVFMGAVLANALTLLAQPHPDLPQALLAAGLIGLGNTGEALLAHHLLTRTRAQGFGLAQPLDVYLYGMVVLVAAMVSAGMGVGTLTMLGVIPHTLVGDSLLTWWLGDVTGMLVVAPPLLLAPSCAAQGWRITRAGQALMSLGLVLLSCMVVFGDWARSTGNSRWLLFLVLVAVVQAAYRHGKAGAGLAGLVVASICTWQTLHGHGPFANTSLNDALISLDGFLALCTVSGLLVSVSKRPASDDGGERRAGDNRTAIAILLVSLGVTITVWHLTASNTDRRAEERFEQASRRLRDRVAERMATYSFALSGGRGLFDAKGAVSKADWQAYVSSLHIQQRFPGIQGLGYAQFIPGPTLQAFEAAMQRAGHVGYQVRPRGARADYTSILYLEPMDERNQRALAYDMFSEQVRHEAMARARDSGEVAVTGRVTLMQENGANAQAGILMYLPVFRTDRPTLTVADRQQALKGFVYAPFRVGDLMHGILLPDELRTMAVALHLSDRPTPQSLAYSSQEAAPPHTMPAQQTRTWPVSFGGQQWSIVAQATPAFTAEIDTQKAQTVLMAGMLISFLLFSVVRSLSLHRQDAQALADNMLREHALSEARFQSLADAASDGIIVTDQSGLISFCNEAAAAMLGQQVTDLLGRRVHDLVPPDSRPLFQQWLDSLQARTTGDTTARSAKEFHALRKDGSLVPVEASLCSWQTHGTGYLGLVIRDITDRLEAMAQLEQSRATLSAILSHIPAMVGSWDKHLHNRFCNPAYTDWFGIDPQATVGKHIIDVLGAELFERNRPYIERVLQGEHVQFERQITSPDGRMRHAQSHYIPDVQSGQVEGFFVLVFDITQLKLAKQALRQHLKVHDVIFKHSAVGIALTRGPNFEHVSREFTRLLGYTEGDLDHMPLSVMFPDPEQQAELMGQAAQRLPLGETLDQELLLRRTDGELVWCRVLAKAIDAADMDQGVIWIVQDYRDRKQRESLLQRARDDAEAAARLKAEFLAKVSHEIRTPMNGIIGLTALTLGDELSPHQRENLNLVQESALSLRRLLDDILDFSRMEADKLELVGADFSLREALATTVRPLAVLAAGRQVSFVLDIAPNVPERLYGDSVRLMQVVSNLCGNAVKFTERGEIVCSVAVESMADKAVILKFSVDDTGPGVPPDAMSHIFESFTQADNRLTRRHGGSGLGLAISAQIVRLMDGTLDVHNNMGTGATFWFTVSFQRSSAPPVLPREHAQLFQHRQVGCMMASARAQAALKRQLSAWGMVHQAIEFDDVLSPTLAPMHVLVVEQSQWPSLRGMALPCPVVTLNAPGTTPPRDATLGLRAPWLSHELAGVLAQALSAGAATSTARPATATPPQAPHRQGLDILVAEDHPVNRQLVIRLLEKQGHRVTPALDGLAAVRLFQTRPFDLILMDVQMPDMDGLTAASEIRRLEAGRGRHTPILGLSAHALASDIKDMRASGMDDCLAKPFDAAELIRMIDWLVHRARQSSGASQDAHRS